MPVTEKDYKNEIKKMCEFVSPIKNKKGKDECINTFMCDFHKCNDDLNNYRDARPTEEERKKCFKHKQGNFKNALKCLSKFNKKRDLKNKISKLNHCIANNCPVDIEYGLKNLDYYKNSSNKCKPCEKENNIIYDLTKKKLLQENECSKKYSTNAEATKCNKNNILLKKKLNKSYADNLKCKNQHCPLPVKTSNKLSKTSSKTSSKKSKTSKTSKTSKN